MSNQDNQPKKDGPAETLRSGDLFGSILSIESAYRDGEFIGLRVRAAPWHNGTFLVYWDGRMCGPYRDGECRFLDCGKPVEYRPCSVYEIPNDTDQPRDTMSTTPTTPPALDVPAGSADRCPRCGCQLLDPFGRRVHDAATRRGCAMSHHGAAYEADVESGRTIPGID